MHAGHDDLDRTNRIASFASMPSRLYCKASPLANCIHTDSAALEKSRARLKKKRLLAQSRACVSSCGGWGQSHHQLCATKAHSLTRPSTIVGSLSHRCPDILKEERRGEKKVTGEEEHLIGSPQSSHRLQLPPPFFSAGTRPLRYSVVRFVFCH